MQRPKENITHVFTIKHLSFSRRFRSTLAESARTQSSTTATARSSQSSPSTRRHCRRHMNARSSTTTAAQHRWRPPVSRPSGQWTTCRSRPTRSRSPTCPSVCACSTWRRTWRRSRTTRWTADYFVGSRRRFSVTTSGWRRSTPRNYSVSRAAGDRSWADEISRCLAIARTWFTNGCPGKDAKRENGCLESRRDWLARRNVGFSEATTGFYRETDFALRLS